MYHATPFRRRPAMEKHTVQARAGLSTSIVEASRVGFYCAHLCGRNVEGYDTVVEQEEEEKEEAVKEVEDVGYIPYILTDKTCLGDGCSLLCSTHSLERNSSLVGRNGVVSIE